MPETFEEKSLNERIEYSNSSFYSLSILFRSRGKRESKHANAAASVKWQIASLLPLEIGECVSAANPSPIGSFFSMEKGRQARGEERKKGNLCVVTKRLHGFATTRDANDLLALCASFLLLLFLPSFLPPSILLLRTHAHVTLPRYSRNQFTAPVIFAAIAEIRDLDPFVARASQLIVRPSNPITFPITSNIRKNV